MILDKREVHIINELLRSATGLTITENVSEIPAEGVHKGRCVLNTVKGDLAVDIAVAEDFPSGPVLFFCTSHKGLEHQMHSGLLCLTADPATSVETKFSFELEKLLWWAEKYFVRGEKDEHFEYYHFPPLFINDQMVFEEDETKKKPKGNCGIFSYGLMNIYEEKNLKVNNWIAGGLGGRPARWGTVYQKMSAGPYTGLWLFAERHPVSTGRHRMEDWAQLLQILSSEQNRWLHDEHKKFKSRSYYLHGMLLMLGYEIPGPAGNEVHWEQIFLPVNEFPYEGRKVALGRYEAFDLGQPILWGRSTNAAYSRLFGRGKLCAALTESRITIIGTGAIGSSLYTALLRGGCKYLTIADGDDIDPGNICRGQFEFLDSFKSKTEELKKIGNNISPYAEIDTLPKMIAVRKENPIYKAMQKEFNRADVIFDCSTDKMLSVMLDEMQLRSQVINMSITDGAAHLAVISGAGNIHRVKSNLFERISPYREPFFVATGCWHPTFRAAYPDLNVLLMYALTEINLRLERSRIVSSFYIERKISETQSVTYELVDRV